MPADLNLLVFPSEKKKLLVFGPDAKIPGSENTQTFTVGGQNLKPIFGQIVAVEIADRKHRSGYVQFSDTAPGCQTKISIKDEC